MERILCRRAGACYNKMSRCGQKHCYNSIIYIVLPGEVQSACSSQKERMQTRFSFQEAAAFLNGFTNYEKLASLTLKGGDRERMRGLLEKLGDPQRSIRSIHVTGSKGKGTCCLFLESLLAAQGYSVGAYLSPHLECVTERIRLNGAPLSHDMFARAMSAVRPAVEACPSPPTYFEILTALAWHLFKEEKVDMAVIEAGIGGRLDATSLQDPGFTIITSIEKEHTQVLGATEEAILREKMGIARSGVPLLIGPLKSALAGQAGREAARHAIPLFLWNDSISLEYASERAHVSLSAPFAPFSFSFRADNYPEAVNAALASACIHCLFPAASSLAGDIERAASQCAVPGRKEVFKGAPPVVLDVAHTVQSLEALKTFLASRFPGVKKTVVFAVARDKDVEQLLGVVTAFADRLVVVCADPVRGAPAEALARLAAGTDVFAASTTEQALRHAVEKAGETGLVCVCGSFVAAGQARRLIREHDPRP